MELHSWQPPEEPPPAFTACQESGVRLTGSRVLTRF